MGGAIGYLLTGEVSTLALLVLALKPIAFVIKHSVPRIKSRQQQNKSHRAIANERAKKGREQGRRRERRESEGGKKGKKKKKKKILRTPFV